MRHRRQYGFTLVELLIVVIVVGVLAAVAIPLYQLAPERSKGTEAVAGLGLIRDAMRTYHAEFGTYVHPSFVHGAQVTTGGILNVKDEDLLGRYFSTECYTFDGAPTDDTFLIRCDGANSTALRAEEVVNVVRTINENGDVGQE